MIKNKRSNKIYTPGIFALFRMSIGSNLATTLFSYPWRGIIGMYSGLFIGFLSGKLVDYLAMKKVKH
ncbi:hypothetical protein [Clostridium sp. UBA7503]|uniref:hypothetical protein n=1 Tax=Clostridium sp. UBA7503 TaxID=1946377 RepID=UPI0032175A13